MSVRTQPTILPRQLHGIPLHPLTLALRPLPERLRDRIARAVARRASGDLSPYGLPIPPQGPYERMRTSGVTVAVDQGFVAHPTAGRLTVVGAIDPLDRSDAVLRDGTRLQPDVILTATGYHPGLTGLVGHLDALAPHGEPHRSTPGLYFIGYQSALEANLRQHPAEARLTAQAITRRPARPRIAVG
ncbi:hypothetical protein [Streptomyces sp. N35]|uniref:hypothetical protein n=1 Tax=Streptomyces sp. N35 TaxID=2795730 RepID=UPI0018F6DE9E|nr:hypothetical protein [Streptomyces sp. N35]